MATTFGEINYSDEGYGDKKSGGGGKDLFLRLVKGDNEIRLVTAPHQYLVHKIKKDPTDKKDFGQKVNCSAVHGHCPACAMGDEAKPRILYGVISRANGTYKILDVSYSVFTKIRQLARNVQRWGDPTKYDLNVVVDPHGGPANYYSVQPLPKEPLSAADQQIKDNVDLDDLKRRVTPPTPEMVQKRLDNIFGDMPQPGKKVVTTTTAKPVTKTAAVDFSDDESDDSFPDYDSK